MRKFIEMDYDKVEEKMLIALGALRKCKKTGVPALPRLPDKLVRLPSPVVLPEGQGSFAGWAVYVDDSDSPRWEYATRWGGSDSQFRYAVKPDTEVARLNGVGFGPCPDPHGWHNPQGLTPQDIGVPHYRLLTRSEIGDREDKCRAIEAQEPADTHTTHRWRSGYRGNLFHVTYRTRQPYGALPKTTNYEFKECAPAAEAPAVDYADLVKNLRVGTVVRKKYNTEYKSMIGAINATGSYWVFIVGNGWITAGEFAVQWEHYAGKFMGEDVWGLVARR